MRHNDFVFGLQVSDQINQLLHSHHVVIGTHLRLIAGRNLLTQVRAGDAVRGIDHRCDQLSVCLQARDGATEREFNSSIRSTFASGTTLPGNIADTVTIGAIELAER